MMIGYYCIAKEKPKNKILRWSIIMSWDMLGLGICIWFLLGSSTDTIILLIIFMITFLTVIIGKLIREEWMVVS